MSLTGKSIFTLLVVAVLAGPEDDLIAGTRTFTGKLYKELIKNKPNQNIIFSPLTVQTLLGLLSSASQNENDEVIKEIRTALSLPYGDDNRQAAFQYILGELNKTDDDFKVFDATKMYFKSGYWVKDWYQKIVQNVYRAEIETADFGNSWGTSQRINQWVASKTQNKITNFVDYYDITANTQNLLINTLYLIGKWEKPFKKDKTTWKNFNGLYGPKQVEMMNHNKTYDYYENGDAQYLKLDLLRDGGGAEMVVVLPKEQQGLTRLEYNVQNLLQPVTFTSAVVDVTLPKFSFSNDMKLKPILQNIGVNKLFQWGAELKGLQYPGHPFIIITDVLQKAFIEVDEWGVTAAAAAKVIIRVDTPPEAKKFTADHPFLFYIAVDDAIIYAGRVMTV